MVSKISLNIHPEKLRFFFTHLHEHLLQLDGLTTKVGIKLGRLDSPGDPRCANRVGRAAPFWPGGPRGFPMDFSHENPWLKTTPWLIFFETKISLRNKEERANTQFFNGDCYYYYYLPLVGYPEYCKAFFLILIF